MWVMYALRLWYLTCSLGSYTIFSKNYISVDLYIYVDQNVTCISFFKIWMFVSGNDLSPYKICNARYLMKMLTDWRVESVNVYWTDLTSLFCDHTSKHINITKSTKGHQFWPFTYVFFILLYLIITACFYVICIFSNGIATIDILNLMDCLGLQTSWNQMFELYFYSPVLVANMEYWKQ